VLLDIEIFTLLRGQVVEVFAFLLIMRKFASGKGLQKDVEKIDSDIAENHDMLLLANNQLSDLNKTEMNRRMGFFDTI
jgi:hypothetical protein